MKRLIVMLGLLLWVTPVISAQDETTAACEIDLTSTVSLLMQAQGMAASGNTERALAQIELARTKLEAFEAACGEVVVDVPVTPVELALTQSFTLEESYGDMTFNYPEGWAQSGESGDVLVATGSDVLNRDFGSEPPPFASGEALIYVGLGDGDDFSDDDLTDPLALMEALSSEVPPTFGTQTEPVRFTVNDKPAASFTVSGTETDLIVMAVKLGGFDGETLFAQFILLTAPGELDVYAPTLQAVAESVELAR